MSIARYIFPCTTSNELPYVTIFRFFTWETLYQRRVFYVSLKLVHSFDFCIVAICVKMLDNFLYLLSVFFRPLNP